MKFHTSNLCIAFLLCHSAYASDKPALAGAGDQLKIAPASTLGPNPSEILAIAARQVAGKLKKKVAHNKQPERIGIADLLDSLELSAKRAARDKFPIIAASTLGSNPGAILVAHGIPHGRFADRDQSDSDISTRHTVLLLSKESLEPIGYCGQLIRHHDKMGFIRAIGISDSHQNNECGDMLLEEALEYMRSKVHKVSLSPVERAVPFYQRRGFTWDADELTMSLVFTPRPVAAQKHKKRHGLPVEHPE